MSHTPDEYWQKVTATLGEDGPVEVPPSLAARATQRALSTRRDAPRFFDVLSSLLRPAALVTATAAAVVWGAVGLGSGNARDFSSSSQSLYASVTDPVHDDSLYASVLSAPRRGAAR